ncbi:triose-phosphate isomerase [Alloscardovia theropitheci]|uniref:Triosephosphate isomerase n=1 Tax=Alloscardovia theropitheci TaxID=2496842 RepID=A0A4R0QR05_9BIFI|nr:triose-phosphate isomerase [Alloscardovia theropitheci]TCD54764.1 triose-phosphate isomerase [Alloscardovia theropitheci]
MSQRMPLVVGNWKMNLNHREATYFLQKLAWLLRDAHFDYKECEIAILPPFTSIRSVQVLVEADRLNINYGAQTVSVTAQGAFTGDVSADMLSSLGCKYVLVGHSERRRYYADDDANLVDQVRAVLTAGMTPILCVGEGYEERREGIELDYAVGQVDDITRDISEEDAQKMIIAYEPVWAIGTGLVATPQSAEDAAQAIRTHLTRVYSKETANKVRILYGGSVTASNATLLMNEARNMDGFLVGGASLEPEEFATIIRLASKAAKNR